MFPSSPDLNNIAIESDVSKANAYREVFRHTLFEDKGEKNRTKVASCAPRAADCPRVDEPK